MLVSAKYTLDFLDLIWKENVNYLINNLKNTVWWNVNILETGLNKLFLKINLVFVSSKLTYIFVI